MTPDLTCATCRDLLPDYVARTLDAPTSASMARHVATCADCRAELAVWQNIDAALHRRDARLPGDAAAVAGWRALHAQVMSSSAVPALAGADATPLHEMSISAMNDTQTNSTPKPPVPAPRRAPWVAAIAAVLIAVLGVATFAVFAQHGPHKGVATSAPPTATPVPPTPVPANIPIDPATGLPKTGNINALAMDGPNDGWAVGDVVNNETQHATAYTLHYDGTRWQAIGPSIPDAVLSVVSIAAPGDVWAAGVYDHVHTSSSGATSVTTSPLALHFYDGTWHMATLPGIGYPDGITMLSATTGWAYGQAAHPTAAASTVLLRYQHGIWSPVAVPDACSTSCVFAMFSLDEGWMGGDQGFWHYQNGVWHLALAESHINFATISMSGPNDGWAGGTIPTASLGGEARAVNQQPNLAPTSSIGNVKPFLMHYDGTTWHMVTVPAVLNANHGAIGFITMNSATDGWMQAENGDGTQFVLQYDGHIWASTNFPAPLIFVGAISSDSPDDAWACGSKIDQTATNFSHGVPTVPVLLHYTNGTWQVYTQP